MNYTSRQLVTRIMFLGIFVLTVFGVYWMSKSLSKSQQPESSATVVDDFVPVEAGKAVLVEFSDFQCPACGMYYPLVKQLKTEFGDKLDVVYKHFPLKSIHKNAELAARASEAARLQGKFIEMHNILFEKQKEWSDSDQTLSLFTAYALEIGLDKEKFTNDIDKSETYDKVNANYQEGVRLKVNGTPTFYLNGKKITNPASYNDFKLLIEQSVKQ